MAEVDERESGGMGQQVLEGEEGSAGEEEGGDGPVEARAKMR